MVTGAGWLILDDVVAVQAALRLQRDLNATHNSRPDLLPQSLTSLNAGSFRGRYAVPSINLRGIYTDRGDLHEANVGRKLNWSKHSAPTK